MTFKIVFSALPYIRETFFVNELYSINHTVAISYIDRATVVQ